MADDDQHPLDGFVNSTMYHGRQAACAVCEPSGDLLQDTPSECQAEMLKELCDGLRIDSDNEGEMPSEEELRGLRFACYKCWSSRIIRIWGIRVQPPPCVLE